MSLEKEVVVGGSYRQPGVGRGCWGGWPGEGKESGEGPGEKSYVCLVTEAVTLDRFWTRASGGGW